MTKRLFTLTNNDRLTIVTALRIAERNRGGVDPDLDFEGMAERLLRDEEPKAGEAA